MTVYKLHFKKRLEVHSMSYQDYVEIKLETNRKEVLDYWDEIFNELLDDEHYLDYLKIEEDIK